MRYMDNAITWIFKITCTLLNNEIKKTLYMYIPTISIFNRQYSKTTLCKMKIMVSGLKIKIKYLLDNFRKRIYS